MSVYINGTFETPEGRVTVTSRADYAAEAVKDYLASKAAVLGTEVKSTFEEEEE